jgi:antitoxin CptB
MRGPTPFSVDTGANSGKRISGRIFSTIARHRALERVPRKWSRFRDKNALKLAHLEHDSAIRRFRLIASCSGQAGARTMGALYRGPLMSIDDARLKKLKFRAWRRGFREADLILGPFADKHVQDMAPDELDAFERLLEVPDQDLYAWITDRLATPPEWDIDLMHKIKAFRFESYTARGDDNGG